MGHIRDLWFDRDGNRSKRYGRGNRYEARYVDPAGKDRSRTFPNKGKAAAEAFLTTLEADKLRGTYIDPDAGRATIAELAEEWLTAQTFDTSTHEVTERRIRRHLLPALGDLAVRDVKPSRIQAWVKGLQQTVSPDYARITFWNLSSILSAAVEDGLLPKNPCQSRSIRLPVADDVPVVPWTQEQVAAVHAALPQPYAVALILGAYCGMRQGEVLGLAVEDIDFLRGWVHVNRQVKIVGNRLVFDLPKGRKKRKVPLSPLVALELSRHIAEHPTTPLSLPWRSAAGEPVAARLLLRNRHGRALNRNAFNEQGWRPARAAAGVPATRANGFHALRHFFASVLLDAGENVNALAEYLGHEDPAITLRIYAHLMPASEARTRNAIDGVFRASVFSSDGTETGRDIL